MNLSYLTRKAKMEASLRKLVDFDKKNCNSCSRSVLNQKSTSDADSADLDCVMASICWNFKYWRKCDTTTKRKLDIGKAREIKELIGEGIPLFEIAKMYGVSDQSIWNLKHGHTWREA